MMFLSKFFMFAQKDYSDHMSDIAPNMTVLFLVTTSLLLAAGTRFDSIRFLQIVLDTASLRNPTNKAKK